ncbi:MAG: phage holin family protein [Actinomycetes bacterium]|nr:phage holin family protein [Actinomycetes bacterium]MDX5380732.1 phage holin family protein [Actinomycetes bacterium]MDX5399731.1 phage holin family protein [Actinomycetes bacterium]MDX5450470.1 phage holin family protein [Actinomycetes bacterium]
MSFVIRFIVNGVAIWLASLLLSGLHLAEGEDTGTQVLIVAVVALVFTLVNMIVKPLVQVLSLPLLILTLGLFSLVVNALMLMLTGWISTNLGYGLEVDGFWWAVAGGIVIGLVAWALNLVLPDGRR